jgi:hypothetical protein
VFTVRCTRSFLKRLEVPPEPCAPVATTKLGDWYANLLYTKPQQLILCVSEKTLLPVVIPAKGIERVAVRLTDAVGEMLLAIGIAERVVEAELVAMADSTISTTASRTVLGSMNDFAFMLESHLGYGDSLAEASLNLANSPCSPIGMSSPREATIELLSKYGA